MKTTSHNHNNTEKWKQSMLTPQEKNRRSIAMKKLNANKEHNKTCSICKQPFIGGLTQKICSKQCLHESWLLRKYGITSKDRAELFNKQQGRCAICDRQKKLVIDHCHITGRVRGLLCRVCNSSLYFFENPEILSRGIMYTTNEIKK